MADLPSLWPVRITLSEVQRARPTLELEADGARRGDLAGALGLVDLLRLSAIVKLDPWLDGVEARGAWSAEVVQTCGVSLEDFTTLLSGAFVVRAVPTGSSAAPSPSDEMTIDPDAEDPPELLDGDRLDVGALVVEHLALEIDPFPRRPGAVFEPPADERPPSPFAGLSNLKPVGSRDG